MANRERGQVIPLGGNKFRIRYQAMIDGIQRTIFDERFEGTQAQAYKRKTELLADYDKGKLAAKNDSTLEPYYKYWNTHANRSDVGDGEIANSEIIGRRYLFPRMIDGKRFGDMRLQDIRAKHIRFALADAAANGRMRTRGGKAGVPLSKATIRQTYDALKQCLDLAKIDELIAVNPCESVDRPPLEKRKDMVLPQLPQVEAFFAKCMEHSEKLALYALLASETGFRLGECGGVRGSTINRQFKSIRCNAAVKLDKGSKIRPKPYFLDTHPKTANGFRTVKVTDTLLDAIDAYIANQNALREKLGVRPLGEDDPIFLNADGSLDRMDTISKQIADACAAAGFDGSLHMMRHAHASYKLVKEKIDIKTLQKRLGHASPQTTLNLYVHLIEETY